MLSHDPVSNAGRRSLSVGVHCLRCKSRHEFGVHCKKLSKVTIRLKKEWSTIIKILVENLKFTIVTNDLYNTLIYCTCIEIFSKIMIRYWSLGLTCKPLRITLFPHRTSLWRCGHSVRRTARRICTSYPTTLNSATHAPAYTLNPKNKIL